MRRDYPGDEDPSSCEIEAALGDRVEDALTRAERLLIERLRTTTADLPAAMDGVDQNDG